MGIHELGGHAVVLREGEMQLSRGESVRDTALVLSRYVAAIGVRTGAHEPVAELAEHATVPVVNMLTADHHPCQALADLLTLKERFGRLEGLKLAYVGDGNNVAALADDHRAEGRRRGRRGGARGAGAAAGRQRGVLTDPAEAVQAANAVYTDVWFSMGDEDGGGKRELLEPYRLDDDLLGARRRRRDRAALPARARRTRRSRPRSSMGRSSAVWDQAENRLHAQKALLELLVAR